MVEFGGRTAIRSSERRRAWEQNSGDQTNPVKGRIALLAARKLSCYCKILKVEGAANGNEPKKEFH
jgi:hypothetical protein